MSPASELTLDDVETAASIVQEAANPEANIIFGATYSDEFEDEMRVTVIATGFESKKGEQHPSPSLCPVPAPLLPQESAQNLRRLLLRMWMTSMRFLRFSIGKSDAIPPCRVSRKYGRTAQGGMRCAPSMPSFCKRLVCARLVENSEISKDLQNFLHFPLYFSSVIH